MKLCKNCRYWHDLDYPNPGIDGVTGQCRRNPPMQTKGSTMGADCSAMETDEAVWPITEPDDWCGEFNEKDSQSIEILKLGGSREYSLMKAGFKTINQLKNASDKQLKRVHLVGDKTISKIRNLIDKLNRDELNDTINEKIVDEAIQEVLGINK